MTRTSTNGRITQLVTLSVLNRCWCIASPLRWLEHLRNGINSTALYQLSYRGLGFFYLSLLYLIAMLYPLQGLFLLIWFRTPFLLRPKKLAAYSIVLNSNVSLVLIFVSEASNSFGSTIIFTYCFLGRWSMTRIFINFFYSLRSWG